MAEGAHDSGEGFGRSAGANAARGVIVIVVAVILGVLLMQNGLDSVDTDTSGASSDTEADVTQGESAEEGDEESVDASAGDEDGSTATTVAPELREPNEVKVLVLNAAGIKGIAGSNTDRFKASNYRTAEAADAAEHGPSMVLYMEGFQAEAEAIAQEFYQADPAAVVAAYDSVPPPIADPSDANVVVLIGNDGVFGS